MYKKLHTLRCSFVCVCYSSLLVRVLDALRFCTSFRAQLTLVHTAHTTSHMHTHTRTGADAKHSAPFSLVVVVARTDETPPPPLSPCIGVLSSSPSLSSSVSPRESHNLYALQSINAKIRAPARASVYGQSAAVAQRSSSSSSRSSKSITHQNVQQRVHTHTHSLALVLRARARARYTQ